MSRSLGQLTIDFVARTTGFKQGMDQAAKSARDSSNKISRDTRAAADSFKGAWGGAIKNVTALFAVFGAAATFSKMQDSIVGFQDSMLKLQATSRATSEDMARMEKQARALGATTRYSAQQAADAQNFLAMAGFNTASILEATGDVINFASAASVDLARSADIASNVLGQMKLPVSDLSKAMDVMISTTQSSNTNVEQLAEALSFVGPVAAAAGIEIAELSAAIGVLGDAGIQGGRAGTGLQGIIQRLLTLTPAAAEALSRYGVTIQDVDITTHGLTEVLKTLRDANISAADSMTIFGAVSAAAGLNLASAADNVGKLTEANVEAIGRTQEVASILDSKLSAAFASVTSAIEETMIRIGEDGLGGSMQLLAATTAGVINHFNGLLPQFAEANGLSAEFTSNIELLTNAIKVFGVVAISTLTGRLVAALAANVVAWGLATAEAVKYQAALARMAGVSASAAAGLTALTGVARSAGAAMAVFGGPLGLLVTIGLTAAAMLSMGSDAKTAASGVDVMTKSLEGLRKEQLEALRFSLSDEIAKQEKVVNQYAAEIKGLERDYEALKNMTGVTEEELSNVSRTITEATADYQDASDTLTGMGKRYEEVSEAVYKLTAVTEESVIANNKAEIAKKLATQATTEFVAELDKESKKLEDSIKTVRQLADEYILLHGIQGGNLDLINEAVARHEKASKAAENHRKTLADLGKSAANSAKQMDNAIKSLVGGLFPTIKATDDLAKNTKTLDEALKRGTINAKQHAQGLAQLKKQYDDAVIASVPHLKTLSDLATDTQNNVKALTDQVKAYGETEISIARKSLAETNARIVTMETIRATQLATGASKEYIKQVDLEIAKLKELQLWQEHEVGLLDIRATQEGYEQMQNDAIAMNEKIGETLTDALMRAFESGQSFAEAMKSVVLNMFKTMVLQPLIQPIITGVGGALGLSQGGAQQSAGGGLGSFSPFTGFAGSMSGAVQSIGGTLTKLGGSFGDFGANLIMNADTIGATLDKVGAGFAYASSIFQMTKGNWGAGLGGAAGQFLGGPIGSFIGSQLGGMLDQAFKGETRFGGSFHYATGTDTTHFGGGPSGGYGGEQAARAMNDLLKQQAQSIQAVIDGVGATNANVTAFIGAFESSEKGRGGTYSGGYLEIDGTEVYFGTSEKGQGFGDTTGSTEEMFANMQRDFSFSMLEAWQLVGDQMPKIISDKLVDIDIRGMSIENAETLVAEIQTIVASVNVLQEALSTLPFTNLQDLSFDLAASLMQAAGGFDALIGGLESFYNGFYSEQERFDIAAKQLKKSIEGMGLTLPETRQEFRLLVESFDALNEANHETIAGLLGLSGAADQFYTEIEKQAEEAIKNAQDFASQMQKANQDIKNTFDNLVSSIMASFSGLRERITLDIMEDDSERYAYYKQQFDKLSNEIDFTEDATRLNEIVREMNQIAGTAYGLLDEDVRKGGKGQEYLDMIATNERRALEKAEQLRQQELIESDLRFKQQEQVNEAMKSIGQSLDITSDRLESAALMINQSAENIARASTGGRPRRTEATI